MHRGPIAFMHGVAQVRNRLGDELPLLVDVALEVEHLIPLSGDLLAQLHFAE
jgi:hypothetical protein